MRYYIMLLYMTEWNNNNNNDDDDDDDNNDNSNAKPNETINREYLRYLPVYTYIFILCILKCTIHTYI